MDISLGDLLTGGAMLVAGASSIAYTRSKIDGIESIKSQIKKLWDYKDASEKEANGNRIEIERNFGAIRADLAHRDGEYEEIIRRLEENKESMAALRLQMETLRDKLA